MHLSKNTLLPLALLAALAAGPGASAFGTDKPDRDVMYQGQLLQNGQAQGGVVMMDIDFFSDPGGTQSLGFISNMSVTLDSQGRFTIDLPGTLFNDGSDVWMRFTVEGVQLSPLQPAMAATTANYSLNTRGLHVSEATGEVGIGTVDPGAPLHVVGQVRSTGTGAAFAAFNPNNGGASAQLGWLNDVARIRVGGSGPGANGGLDIQRIGDASLLRILDSGFVGIGTAAPEVELHVRDAGPARLWLESDTNNSGEGDHAQILMTQDDGLVTSALGFFDSTNDFRIRTEDVGNPLNPVHLLLEPSGGVGIGSADPGTLLDVIATDFSFGLPAGASAARFTYDGPVNGLPIVLIRSDFQASPNGALRVEQSSNAAYAGVFVGEDTAHALRAFAQGNGYAIDAQSNNGLPLRVTSAGGSTDIAVFRHVSTNMARIDTTGRGFFNGGTQTGGADVAEAFEVEGDVSAYEPGDVLVISTTRDRTVALSAEPYSTLVAGVHATRPGLLLSERHIDESHADTVPMGVVGVIPTKVCGENGPIRRGDLLVTASRSGHAMKGTDRGRMTGAILGKALEEFDPADPGAASVIRVMVNVK